MLRLRKVELHGFKSFSRRTTIRFNGTGIAAVVGPNGCGKSNIADAILWVLGEQSPRTLRSGRMADCIFNGTATEPPTNLAEVTLTLLDPAATSPPLVAEPARAADGEEKAQSDEPKRKKNRLNLKILAGEVVVTRRLYRSGQSEYYLNGELCRLRDIQELFMGTGLGPESYAIIEQGRIGQILSSRPTDRRALIEEAAGVSKYKTKRRLAEAKLESAQHNLLRLNDIFEEVTRQLNSLKRQAARARRYQELKSETQQLRRRLLASRFTALQAAETQAAAQLDENARELERLAGEIQISEQAQDQTETRRSQFESGLRRQENLAGQLILELERAHTRLAEARRQYGELGRQLEELAGQQQRLLQECEQTTATQTQNAALREQVATEFESTRTALDFLTTQQEALRQEITAREQQLERWQQECAECTKELASAQAETTQVETLRAAADEQISQLEEWKEQTDRERARVVEEQTQAQATLAEAQRETQRLESEMRAREQALAEMWERQRSQKTQVEELRQSLATATAQQQALEGLLAQRAAFAEPVQKLFAVGEGSTASGFRSIGVVADFAELDLEHAPLLEEYLHDELQYVVVENYEAARSGVQILREEATGQATFLVDSFGRQPLTAEPWRPSEAETTALHTGNGVVASLRELVRFRGPLGPEAARFLPRLSRTYLVRSAQVAEEMARKHPHLFFLSTDGTWYHGRLVTGGSPNGHGPTWLSRELESVADTREKLSPVARAVESSLHALDHAIGEEDLRQQKLRESLFAHEKRLLEHKQRLQSLETEQARQEEEERHTTAELEARRAARETLARRLADLEKRREDSTTLVSEGEASLTSARSELQTLRQLAADQANEVTQLSARLAALEERRLAAEHERERLAAEQAQHQADQQSLERLAEQLTEEREQAAQSILHAETELKQREEEKHAAEATSQAMERELEVTRQALFEIEAKLRASRAELEGLRNRRHTLEVEQAREEADRSHLEMACQSEFGLRGSQLAADCAEPLAGEALEQAEQTYHGLKEKLENLGPVNMMALEEFQECEQRHTFLSKQREDLLASIADTTQAIRELDTASSKLFEEAFAAINQNFAETFRTLFGGGSATLRLTDAENPADSGIDLICQPPGKRLQNVLLLSGGEKALAALALLIAIFRYQPSPFCILDEVDAPLDEANVGRFTRLLEEMSTQTQFILITHNKKTMESAPVLYGVTMQSGISQIVSVRFEEAAPTAA